jgi:energy-coupling factor transporter ATP-binding protein EcfA2
MITRAKFQNFKALRDVEVTFDSRLTVLVGPNGSGKTTVLRGIDELLLLGFGVPLSRAVNFRPDFMFLKYHPEERILLEVGGRADLDGSDIGLRMELGSIKERGAQGLQDEDVHLHFRTKSTDGKWMPKTGDTPSVLNTAKLAQLDPGLLAQPTYPTAGYPTITPRGEGLASALAGLALNAPESFHALVNHLRSIVKQVRAIRFNRYESDREEREAIQSDTQLFQVRTRKHITESLLFDFVTAHGVHASEVSDGTLIILGMLALIYAYPNSPVFLCDDLDHGLHPKAQMELVRLLRRLLQEFPNLQIIATSHSPFILNQMEWNEVRVTSLRDDGSAICARLEDHPEVERWREAMTPGEFWSHIGDDWVKKLDKNRPEKPQPSAAVP